MLASRVLFGGERQSPRSTQETTMKRTAVLESATATLTTDDLRQAGGAFELGFGLGASLKIGGNSKPRPVVAATSSACPPVVRPVVQPVVPVAPVYAAPVYAAPVYAAPVYGWPYC
jgi:hypothetical protein